MLNKAKNGKFKIVISAITLTEVVHLRGFQRLTNDIETKIKDFFEHDFIIVRSVDRRTAELARELMWRFHDDKLRHQDAVHVATAALANVNELNTYDPDLLTLNNKISCASGNLLTISKPFIAQQELF